MRIPAPGRLGSPREDQETRRMPPARQAKAKAIYTESLGDPCQRLSLGNRYRTGISRSCEKIGSQAKALVPLGRRFLCVNVGQTHADCFTASEGVAMVPLAHQRS